MLLSQSGNKLYEPSFSFEMIEASQVGEARRFALVLCSDICFDETQKGRVGIVINELGNNLVRYAQSGYLIIRKYSNAVGEGLEILSVDKGPGLDESVVMQDGYSSGKTPGTGLGSVARQSDEFDIYSTKGRGTILLSRILSKKASRSLLPTDLEVGAINLPFAGEILCGDTWCVKEDTEGFTVIVADGLGHGPLANKAALAAIDTFSENSKMPISDLLPLIHLRLKGTRGAAVFLVAAQANSLSFAGVGNIRTVIQLQGTTKTLITQNGTAGVQIGSVKAIDEAWDGRGYLILHSDGLASRWDLSVYPGIMRKHSAILAAILHRDFSRDTDDSTVIVIRRQN